MAKKEKLKVKYVDIKDKPFRKVTITLPEETFEKLHEMARNENRSNSNMIRHLIDRARNNR